jgi:hypothetical protein
VVVILSNEAGVTSDNDRRGYNNATMFDVVKFSIFRAILNWNPFSLTENPDEPDKSDPVIGHAVRGYAYEGCHLIEYDLARLVYRFDFSIEITITDSDGWQASGVPLESILLDLVDARTGDTLVERELTGLQDVDLSFKGVTSVAVVGEIDAQ